MSTKIRRSTQSKSIKQISIVLTALAAFVFVPPSALADYDVPSYDDGLAKMGRRDFDGAILEFNRAVGYNNRNAKAYFK